MTIPGRVQNGVVILEGNSSLPEGAAVMVTYSAPNGTQTGSAKKRIEFPLVRSSQPGSVILTGKRIAEILDEEDASALTAPLHHCDVSIRINR